jgi:hypothetical protein
MTPAPVIDLKYYHPVRHLSGDTRKEMTHVHWKANIFASSGLHANAHVSPLRSSLPRRPQYPKLHMPESISLYGICSTDIPGEPSRYRSLSPCTTAEVVPHGHSWHRSKVQSRRCQRAAVLAYICRPCPFINHQRPNTLQQRTIRHRSGANCICTGCHDYRSVPLDVSVGYVPSDQSSNQTAYPSGPLGQHSYFHLYLRRNPARCEYPRYTSDRAGRFLCNGSRLPGLCQTQRHISGSRVFCDSLKIQSQMPKNLFTSGRPHNGSRVRSNNYADGILFAQGLSKQTETNKILRYRHQQNSDFPDQQFRSSGTHYRTVCRCCWQVELFFKWIKQNLRIKNFYGTSENAVKTQIWIAILVYVLVAIFKKRLNIPASLYTILQILSVSVFERITLLQLLAETALAEEILDFQNQLNLFT